MFCSVTNYKFCYAPERLRCYELVKELTRYMFIADVTDFVSDVLNEFWTKNLNK